ncbi:hypothetical protein [Clostridium psychrophilum]|uniref:hypothetical protein n=1 Tax=Clostridium psychrophilum TaxID=132926 RepID=UPI001C0B7132|nr:hypothetical protein [Clostridium psychrophilum]MBU3181962.1 hypothetical protein [Clostridium psychrophilum]
MKNSENMYKKVIDKYYNELPNEVKENMPAEETILSDKLNLALNKMNILKTDTPMCNIDILEIIKKGEMIKQTKRNSLEFTCFIALSLLVISSLILLTFYFGEKFFMYYMLSTLIFIPILVIPLAKQLKIGGN